MAIPEVPFQWTFSSLPHKPPLLLINFLVLRLANSAKCLETAELCEPISFSPFFGPFLPAPYATGHLLCELWHCKAACVLTVNGAEPTHGEFTTCARLEALFPVYGERRVIAFLSIFPPRESKDTGAVCTVKTAQDLDSDYLFEIPSNAHYEDYLWLKVSF